MKVAIAALAALFASLPALGATCGPELSVVNAPDVRVGDTWTYRWNSDGKTGLLTEEVKSVSKNRIIVKLTTDSGEWTRYYTRSWAWIARGELKEPEIKFPLREGGGRIPATRGFTQGNETFRISETLEVLGCEPVTVPASKTPLMAVKIKVTGTYSATGMGTDAWSGTQEWAIWYVPLYARYVRYEFVGTSPTNTFRSSRELVSFTPSDVAAAAN